MNRWEKHFSSPRGSYSYSLGIIFFFFAELKQNFIFCDTFCKLQRQKAKLQHTTFQYLTRKNTCNKYASWNKIQGYTVSGILKMSQVLYSAAFLCRGRRGGLFCFLKCCNKPSFHISLEHFWNCITINNLRSVTPSLETIFALLCRSSPSTDWRIIREGRAPSAQAALWNGALPEQACIFSYILWRSL